jgi:peptide/nickel transport system substrate-binding protein
MKSHYPGEGSLLFVGSILRRIWGEHPDNGLFSPEEDYLKNRPQEVLTICGKYVIIYTLCKRNLKMRRNDVKSKLRIMVLAFVLVASLVLAGGGTEKEVTEPAGPQYGGTLTAWLQDGEHEPPSPDPKDAQTLRSTWLQIIQERLTVGDFEKYGPRGTGEFAFNVLEYVPAQYLKGQMLESWEFQPDKTIWHLRKGVYWAPTKDQIARGVMKGPRELTAQDVADWYRYYASTPEGAEWNKFAGDITVKDKYTVEVKFTDYQPMSMLYMGMNTNRVMISPPETRAAGANKWENQIGTGPFMLKEYVVGSHMSYERNPNYWGKTTIDGVEYEVPFIDELKCPIIADEATRISALRTGVLDWATIVPATYWDSLDKTTPELESNRFMNIYANIIHLRSNQPPFDNVNVRRAAMIGTSTEEFMKLEVTGDVDIPLNFWPLFPNDPSVFVPLDELPEACRVLYDYNPTLAKQMLADAGYPNGFKMTLDVLGSDPAALDRAALLKDQWAKIGINVNIKANDSTTQWGYFFNRQYADGLLLLYGTSNPLTAFSYYTSDGWLNAANWSNKQYDELMARAGREVDDMERARLCKEAGLIWLEYVPVLPLNCGATSIFWWPWVKNYYGERNVGNLDTTPMLARAWIDKDLKKSMGH